MRRQSRERETKDLSITGGTETTQCATPQNLVGWTVEGGGGVVVWKYMVVSQCDWIIVMMSFNNTYQPPARVSLSPLSLSLHPPATDCSSYLSFLQTVTLSHWQSN